MFYNSCSSEHHGSYGDGSGLSKAGSCDLVDYFKVTYHPFLQEHCSTCHDNGGTGKGAFADRNINVAWEAFSLTGFSKISGHAVNPGHNAPYSGPQHKEKVDALLQEWTTAEEEKARCLAGTDTPNDPVDVTTWVSTRSKALNAVDEEEVTIRWNLGTEMLNVPDTFPLLTNAFFEISVRTGNILNEPYYTFSKPTLDLSGAKFDLSVTGLKVKLNGEFVQNETTFTYMQRSVRRGEGEDTSLSSGTLVALGKLKSSDVMALAFAGFDNSDLPPPAPGVKIGFSTKEQTATREGGTVSVDVVLNKPVPSHAVTVGLEIDGLTDATNVRGERTIRNEAGDSVTIKNFDWDFSVDTLSMVFLPNQTRKTITITIAEDDRYELKSGENEKVVLRVGTVEGGDVGTTSTTSIIIPDDDPAPNPNSDVMTFSQLMRPGGVLYDQCLVCHNSEDKRGGYDLTDYQQMIDNGVLIPREVNSKMFVRMNVSSPAADPMPLTGLLPTHMRKEVEKWILNGAKND